MFLTRCVEERDLWDMALKARESDVREARALGYPNLFEALDESVRSSVVSGCAACVSGEVLAIYGVAATKQVGVGLPWLCLSDHIRMHARDLVLATRQFFKSDGSRWRLLRNVVHSENEVSIRYLRHFGFQVDDRHPITIESTGAKVFPFWRAA